MSDFAVTNKVIVWSIDDFNTLGLMRELGPYDLDLFFLILGEKGMASSSKYCASFLETKSIEEGFSYLISNYKHESTKPILIISSDAIITFLDKHYDEIEEFFILPLCKQKGNTAKYTDKNTMTALASSIGILCPESRFIKKGDSIGDINYPCLIKPSHERPGHYNEFKFKICNNPKQLKRVMKYINKDSEFILQQYIAKEKDVLVYGARMQTGETVLAGAFIRDRWADSGSSSHGILTSRIPDCINTKLITLFLEKIDFYGLFSFEYGMIKDKAYFFEVNLRNDGTSNYFNQAGANLPLAYVYNCASADYSSVSTSIQNDSWFIDEFFDYENVLKRIITKKKWKKDFAEATVFKYYDKDDLKPWQIVKKSKNKQILMDFVLKKYRLYIVHFLDKLGLRK